MVTLFDNKRNKTNIELRSHLLDIASTMGSTFYKSFHSCESANISNVAEANIYPLKSVYCVSKVKFTQHIEFP